MRGRLLVVTGTGTEIGKTHVSQALLLCLGRAMTVTGMKPIESGLMSPEPTDAERLASASTFHVQHPGYRFDPPVSPHLAARAAGVRIEVSTIRAVVDAARDRAHLVLVELPGGLFTPLTNTLTNADLTLALCPDTVLLVAPDRLGVLHDVGATLRAAGTVPLRIPYLALVQPPRADASTGTNADELRSPSLTVVSIPRASVSVLAHDPPIQTLADHVLADLALAR